MSEPEQTYDRKSLGSHSDDRPPAEIGADGPALAGLGQSQGETTSAQLSDVPEAATGLRDVHQTLVQRPVHDPVTGRFIGGGPNDGGGKTLARSERFWSAVEPIKQDLVGRVRTDLAVDDSTAETLRGLIEAYSEVRLFRTSMFLRLVDQGGPITNKGKARALYRAYLDALD